MISITRRLVRITTASIYSAGRRRAVVIELDPGGAGKPGPGFVGFRLAGTRSTYYLPIDWAWREAMKAEVSRRKKEKRIKRKAKTS